MAHELEIVNGEAQMAYVGDVPWHGLGVAVPEDTSAMDMMSLAGLDWRVEELESFVEFNGEQGAKDAGKWRLEGKEYIVKDGDVIHFRFNV